MILVRPVRYYGRPPVGNIVCAWACVPVLVFSGLVFVCDWVRSVLVYQGMLVTRLPLWVAVGALAFVHLFFSWSLRCIIRELEGGING